MRVLITSALLTVLFVGFGCGAPTGDATSGGEGLGGPPSWRTTPAERDETAVTLRVRAPIRVRLRSEGSEVAMEPGAWRPLAAGQTLQIQWADLTGRVDEDRMRPSREDVAAGRTEPKVVDALYHFADRATRQERLIRFTRPAHGRLHVRHAAPPGRYEDLPARGSVELMTLAISDVADGEVTLRPREGRTQVRTPPGFRPDGGDSLAVWRLFLDIEPLED